MRAQKTATTYNNNAGSTTERNDHRPGPLDGGDVPLDVYKQIIIEMVDGIQDKTLLKRFYNFISYLYIKTL